MENIIDYTPSITIGMPIKNDAFCIARVLEGLENLDYPKSKIRLVFVDAFSVDGTYETLVKWREKFKPYFYDVVLIRKESNIPQARNLCINNAFGEFILFWDSDVLPPKELLKLMLAVMNSDEKVGIIGADYTYEFKNFYTKIMGQPLVNKEAHQLFMGFTLIRMKIFEKIGIFNELLYRGEDEALVLRLVEETDYKARWAQKPVLHLRSAPESFNQVLFGLIFYSFRKEGEKHIKNFSSLSMFVKLRLLYYGLLPIIVILILLISFYIGLIPSIITIFVYLTIGMLTAIHNSSIRKGILLFLLFNVPICTAISYGAVVYSIRRFFGKLKNS